MTISGKLMCYLWPGLTIEIQALLNIPVHYICWLAATPTGHRQCGKGQKASRGTLMSSSGIILFTYNPLIEYYNHNHLSLKIGYFINHLQHKSNNQAVLLYVPTFLTVVMVTNYIDSIMIRLLHFTPHALAVAHTIFITVVLTNKRKQSLVDNNIQWRRRPGVADFW